MPALWAWALSAVKQPVLRPHCARSAASACTIFASTAAGALVCWAFEREPAITLPSASAIVPCSVGPRMAAVTYSVAAVELIAGDAHYGMLSAL